ncbi:hypothetical protein [Amycolatopsis nigrescens]|uniref:hypothetical protein n=1 Tax=Amycolatopsis nigrescens TaxID=381445 RepID=UPI000369DAA2|nr:hypothetical protein [Amycolatopsis nigrescens]
MEWTPRNKAELVAGWRLWLELSDPVWSTAHGTPAAAVRPLRELQTACTEIEVEYRAAEPEGTAEVLGLLQSIFVLTAAPVELWYDDETPLDDERAALLRADMAGFAEQAERVLAALAQGGGWVAFGAAHRTGGSPG